MNSYENEIEILRKIDECELRSLLGESIVSAVESSYNTNFESVLAKLIILKYGESLLENKRLRLTLIDLADEERIQYLSSKLGCNKNNYMESASWLRKYFSTNYNSEKSRVFVDWLGFSDKFYKKTISDARTSMENVSVSHGESVALRGYLHPYQKDIKDQVLSSLANPGVRLMVQMPTGAGKTFTALETAVDILRRPFQERYVVWLVNTNELAEQAFQSFKGLWKVKGDRPLNLFRLFKDFISDYRTNDKGGFVFASYDLFYSILNNIDDDRRPSLLHLIDNTQYLIVDEAHAAVAETYDACINAFINNDVTQIVGLSATPIREDLEEVESLRKLFSNNLISIRDNSGNKVEEPIRYLQDESYLANVKTETLDSDFISTSKSENQILRSLSEDSARNELIVKQIEHANNIKEKTLVFACTVDHVLALYIMCVSRGINVDFIIGETPQSERPKILAEFNNGDINVLINLDILSTGIDLPNVNRLIITRPVKSSIQYSQVVGRALRGPRNGGNPQNTIVNIVDNINYFSGISLLYDSFRNAWG